MHRRSSGEIPALNVMQLSSTVRQDERNETRDRAAFSAFAHSIDEPRQTNERLPLLVFDGLVKSYGKTVFVDHLSLTLQRFFLSGISMREISRVELSNSPRSSARSYINLLF